MAQGSSQGQPTQVDTPDIGDKRSGRPAEWPWYTSCSQNDREQCLEARAGHDRPSRKFVCLGRVTTVICSTITGLVWLCPNKTRIGGIYVIIDRRGVCMTCTHLLLAAAPRSHSHLLPAVQHSMIPTGGYVWLSHRTMLTCTTEYDTNRKLCTNYDDVSENITFIFLNITNKNKTFAIREIRLVTWTSLPE